MQLHESFLPHEQPISYQGLLSQSLLPNAPILELRSFVFHLQVIEVKPFRLPLAVSRIPSHCKSRRMLNEEWPGVSLLV